MAIARDLNPEERIQQLADDPEIRRLARRMGITRVDPETHAIYCDTDRARRAELVTGEDPDAIYPVPDKKAFEADFLPAEDLQAIARQLFARHIDRFRFLIPQTIEYLWRAEGGMSNGKATLGKCTKPGGLLRHFSEAAYVIWAAADHCRDLRLTRRQVEALVFHELCHCTYDDNGALKIAAHDFAGFESELKEYGCWTSDLRQLRSAMEQLPLWDEDQGQESD